MGQLVSLNITKRNSNGRVDDFSPALPIGFDVEDIVVPIREKSGVRYFTARQLKGNTPVSRIVGGTDYETSDSFAAIAAKSNSLLLLTVIRRRDVAVPSETYIFVAGRISESLREHPVTKHTTFFYQEDGDPDLVEYEVDETLSSIIAQNSSINGHIIADEGNQLPQQQILNFVGAGVTATDNPMSGETVVTIPGSMPAQTADVDMTVNFAAGVLTIPPAIQEYDQFKLTVSGGNVINKIVGLSTNLLKKQRFITDFGLTQDFVHTPVAGAVANDLISDAAATNTINGDHGDFIEYETVQIAGPVQVNRRSNININA